MTPHLTLSKKILSILLSVLLVVAFVPAVAFAGNDANDEVVAFDETVADRPVYDADDSFGGVDDSDFGGVDNSGDTEGSGGGTEITTWPDPSESENGTTENNQGSQEGKELKENSWRYTNGELTVSDKSEDAGIEAYSTRSNSNKRPVARGIDVSEHNGTINWNAVKNSGQVDFAILRVGYGDDYSYQDDKQWARNVSECERLGIPYGVYIYSYATSWSQLNSEVSHVKRLLKGHNPSYPVYIDMEDNSTIGLGRNTLTQFAKSFCDQINSAGYTAGVYANLNWWNNYLYASQLDNYERWVAQYNSSCWYEGDYSLWQYSSSGSVPGISGNVDMNYYYGAAGSVPDNYETPDTPYVQTIADGEYYITTSLNNYSVLDIVGGSKANGGNLQLYETNKSVAQRFKIERDSSTGFYSIINTNSGMALGLESMRVGYDSNVAQYSLDSDDNSQKWIIAANSDGTCTIKSAVNPAYVMDIAGASLSNGANVQVYTSNGTNAQKFKFSSTKIDVQGGDEILEGLYSISSELDSSKVLDVANGSVEEGAFLQLYSANESQAQTFKLQKATDGFYYIVNLKSGKALEVQGGGLVNGARVQQSSLSQDEERQLWSLTENEDGSYTVISKVNGLALDVRNGKAGDGAIIQTWESNGSAAQRFVFEARDYSEGAVADGVYVIQSAGDPNYALDIASGSMSKGGNVQLYRSNSTPAQSFKVTYDKSTGYYTITNLKSGKVLDVTGAQAKNNSNVQQYDSNGTLAQKWVIEKNADESYTIKSAIDQNYVVDITSGRISNGSNIQMYRSNGSSAQKFSFVSAVKAKTISEGTYVFTSSINQSYVMDVAGASNENGANVQIYENNGTKAQIFQITYDSSTGYYTITSTQSGKILDTAGGIMRNGTNIWQYESNDTFAQKWIIEKNADGSYTIKAALDPEYVLDVKSGRASNGNNVQLYESNNSVAQKFSISPVS